MKAVMQKSKMSTWPHAPCRQGDRPVTYANSSALRKIRQGFIRIHDTVIPHVHDRDIGAPAVLLRPVHDPRLHRIQVDIAARPQKIAIRFHQAGHIPPLKSASQQNRQTLNLMGSDPITKFLRFVQKRAVAQPDFNLVERLSQYVPLLFPTLLCWTLISVVSVEQNPQKQDSFTSSSLPLPVLSP